MPDFAISARGYSRKAVDEYLAANEKQVQARLDTFADRNQLLNDQIAALQKEAAEYRANEKRLADALLAATGYRDTIQQQVTAMADIEAERLRRFQQKWTAYAQRYLRDNHESLCEQLQQQCEAYRSEVRQNLTQDLLLTQDPVYRDWQSENRRAPTDPTDAPIHLDELLRRLKENQ